MKSWDMHKRCAVGTMRPVQNAARLDANPIIQRQLASVEKELKGKGWSVWKPRKKRDCKKCTRFGDKLGNCGGRFDRVCSKYQTKNPLKRKRRKG